jgi:hypothetical protein
MSAHDKVTGKMSCESNSSSVKLTSFKMSAGKWGAVCMSRACLVEIEDPLWV